MMTIGMPATMPSPDNSRKIAFWRVTLDPESMFVNKFDHILLMIGLFSLYIDTYFHYLPIVEKLGSITLDLQLGFSVSFARIIGDSLLFLGIILKFRTAYEDRVFHVFGKRELVKDSRLIATKYLKSSFIIDLLAALPLPQVFIWGRILASKPSEAIDLYYNLLWICDIQFLPRMAATLLVYWKIEKNYGIAIKNPWSGTLYILFVYGMLSHFLGAVFYLLYINELVVCSEMQLQKEANASMHDLDQLIVKCSQNYDKEGLISEAFANNVGSRSFSQKFMFCFSWGLKTISSMGQNLNSRASVTDTAFVLLVIIIGLLLFADLIARMQTCMQSVGEREERLMVRQRELEDWTKFQQLPPFLKKRVLETVQYQFHVNRGIESEAILDSLPMDLRRDIRRHLYLELLHNLPIFEEMDEQLLHAICGYLRMFTGTEGMFLVLEGDPVQQVLFIFSGQLEMFSIDSGSIHATVGPGEFCGQELLTWASLSSTSTDILPSSTHTIKCMTDVGAFSLLARDVKFLATQFNYDKKLFDAFRCHSP